MRRFGQFVLIISVFLVGTYLAAGAADVAPTGADSQTAPGSAAVTTGPTPTKKEARSRSPLAVTPEREAAVATFVERNHPELLDLLLYLKSSQSDEYERAVREIFRTTERLAQIRERDRELYDLEVAAWQAQSRVQLLAAKVQMDSSAELAAQLREALKSQSAARLALLKYDRQRTADRLAKLDSDIARAQTDQGDLIDRQLKFLTRAAGEKRPAKLNTKSSPKATKKKS